MVVSERASGVKLVPKQTHRSHMTAISDWSRPGLTTTASGAVDQQGAGVNWATLGQRP